MINNIGCYLLKDGEKVVYVGQSKNLLARINAHIVQGIKKFDTYEFIYCEEQELDELEMDLIVKYSPIYNSKAKSTRYVVLRQFINRIRKKHGTDNLSHQSIKRLIRELEIPMIIIDCDVNISNESVILLEKKIPSICKKRDI